MSISGEVDQRANSLTKGSSRPTFSRLILYAALFLISGSAGLIYQVVWERLLQLYFGVTTLSVTLIVAAFMCGLGIGSLAGGYYARKVRSQLAAYGYLEVGIGLFGLISPALLIWVGRITAGVDYVYVFGLSFFLLLVPTVLMGATLPFLSQAFVQRVETSGQVIGTLYGINTFGAALGALFSGYLLIGWLGLESAAYSAAGLNIGVGLAALLLARTRSDPVEQQIGEEAERPKSGQIEWGYRTILLAAFLTGFIGLGYEILWIRTLSIVNKHSAYNFPTVLFIFLTALALGGYLLGRQADRTERPTELFWKVEALAGIVAAVCFGVFWLLLDYAPVQEQFQELFITFQRPASPYLWIDGQLIIAKRQALRDLLIYLFPALLLVFPAGVILGGGLPILDRIAIESPQMAGKRVGDIHLANIAGSVLGALAIGLASLPALGTEITMKLLVLGSVSFFLLHLNQQKARAGLKMNIRPSWALAAVPLLLAAWLPGKGEFYEKLFRRGTDSAVLLTEGRDGVLAFSGVGANQVPRNLWIGGEINSFFPANGVYESRELVCAGGSQPKKVLIIGLGGGNSALFYASLPEIEEIVIVELLQNLAPFLEEQLESARYLLANPEVRLMVDDGRRYLYANPEEKFDLITTDPVRNYTLGHNNLYSREALSLYRQHLNPGGVLCAWIDEYHLLPHTAAAVFEHVDEFDDFLIASKGPVYYDVASMQAFNQAYLAAEPRSYTADIASRLEPADLLRRFRRDKQQILLTEQGKPILTDLTPRLEYYYFPPPAAPGTRERGPAFTTFSERIIGD